MRGLLRLLMLSRIMKRAFGHCLVVTDHCGTELEAIGDSTQGHADGDATLGTRLRHHAVELLIVVTVEAHTGLQALGHAIRKDAVANDLIRPEANQLSCCIEKAESVAIGETRHTSHIETVMTYLLHGSHKGTHGLGGIHRSDVWHAPMQEIGGVAAIEGAVQIGCEGIVANAQGTATIAVRMTSDNGVQLLTVGRCDILHIRQILQTAFYLEGNGPSLCQFLQMTDTVHVFQRQQVAIADYFPTLGILQRELHTAELRTLTTVGAAPETVLRGIALSGIAHAKGTMHKHFEFDIGHLAMNLADLLQRQFPGQYDARKTDIAQPAYFLHRPVVGLGGSVEREMRFVLQHFQDAHVLNEDGIDISLLQIF